MSKNDAEVLDYGGLWINGIDEEIISKAATPQEVVAETFQKAEFEAGPLTNYHILEIRKVLTGSDEITETFTAALVDTNLGQMIVIMQYIPGTPSTPGHWWRRIYAAHPEIKRLY